MARYGLWLVATLLWLSVAAPSIASKFEITPTYGYQFGGRLSLVAAEALLDNAADFGIRFGMRVRPDALVEVFYTRQNGQLELRHRDFSDDSIHLDTAVEYYHVGYHYEIARTRFMPFVDVSAGLTRFAPKADDAKNNAYFSFGLGLGFKYMFGSWIGARAHARILSTLPSSGWEIICQEPQGCFTTDGTGVMYQGEAAVGVIVAF